MEMEVQFKVQQTEILFIPLEKECVVLASGVPGLQIVAEEISIFAHPFIGDESLGVRSKADIQSSRLKVFSWNEKMSKTCFISLDFTRVFVDPVSLMNANQSPAEVEMEAEWLEVKWTPDAIHSIAGMLELSIYIASPFLKKHSSNVEASDDGWDIDARNRVPDLKSIDEVVADRLYGSERAKFRCTIKRTLVLFAYNFDEQKHIEYVTVDSLTMSVEKTTGRFRISISQTKLYHMEPDDERQESAKPSEAYLSIQTFALEENKIPNCFKKVVDIFADNVRYDWDLPGQIRVMELVRRVTFSVWEMLYRVRSTYAAYCTPHDSLYNRPWGINPPLTDATESERCAKLLNKLISASGDGLHRMHATNIVVDAKMTREVHLEMQIGIFGGNDLPDLWDFRDISLRFNSHNLLAVDSVHVQHTTDKRRDYVFGEFEEMLRLRMAACGQVGDHDKSRCDGMLIDIEGLRIQLRTDIPFLDHLEDIQHAFAPYLESLTSGMSLFWRPQHEIFYQYFLRVPMTPGQTKVWLTLDNLVVECSDNPLESWLERIYPLWLEELQEQDLRAQILEEQICCAKTRIKR
uniref:Uncharacterized protein n=1 Tax=Globisporangium ultimum (strain ATCC 200006 / CBS 805.95 / DAOM BR144) TaxID=431595 RepID=K3X258_GLOUD